MQKQTVFSHIVKRELSQKSENVATTALSFILESSEDARGGILKLLRGVIPELPKRLWFRTQQMEGSSRPDMWGKDDEGKPHVFVENKFWAGLTENQPVDYLKKLTKNSHPTLLLVVVPQRRAQAVWSELIRRLKGANISTTDRELSSGIVFNVKTSLGPILALTSWSKLLSFLEVETTNDAAARSDLMQLRALCDQENEDAFIPFTAEQMSDQETPSQILQLTSIVDDATKLAIDEGVLFKGKRLASSSDSTGIGYFLNILPDGECGLWFGLYFSLWKKYGGTPLWGYFSTTKWGRAPEVRALIEPWAAKNAVFVASESDGSFAIAIEIPSGQEKAIVIRKIVDCFKEIGSKLSGLKPQDKEVAPDE